MRLLKLLPGKDPTATAVAEPIRCEIVEVKLSSNTPYETLSYAWGPETPLRRIECAQGSYLAVRPTLYEGLLRPRYLTQERVLWIDALCINQGDNQERNHQVHQMKEIYGRAQKLVIWLDGPQNSSAVAAVRELASRLDILVEATKIDWNALANLLRADWFQRPWVLQEMILGQREGSRSDPEVLLQSGSFSWDELVRCCQWLTGIMVDVSMAAGVSVTSALHDGVEKVSFLHTMTVRTTIDKQSQGVWLG